MKQNPYSNLLQNLGNIGGAINKAVKNPRPHLLQEMVGRNNVAGRFNPDSLKHKLSQVSRKLSSLEEKSPDVRQMFQKGMDRIRGRVRARLPDIESINQSLDPERITNLLEKVRKTEIGEKIEQLLNDEESKSLSDDERSLQTRDNIDNRQSLDLWPVDSSGIRKQEKSKFDQLLENLGINWDR